MYHISGNKVRWPPLRVSYVVKNGGIKMKGSDSEWEDEERNPQISWKYTYFLSSPLYQGPHGNHESRKMFYFLAFLRSFPINNNWVRLFWFENHKVKLRWLFDKNPLCCFTTNYYSRPALEMSIPKYWDRPLLYVSFCHFEWILTPPNFNK